MAAALATTAHADEHLVAFHVDELDEAAVCSAFAVMRGDQCVLQTPVWPEVGRRDGGG